MHIPHNPANTASRCGSFRGLSVVGGTTLAFCRILPQPEFLPRQWPTLQDLRFASHDCIPDTAMTTQGIRSNDTTIHHVSCQSRRLLELFPRQPADASLTSVRTSPCNNETPKHTLASGGRAGPRQFEPWSDSPVRLDWALLVHVQEKSPAH